jgi:hypothetical protein
MQGSSFSKITKKQLIEFEKGRIALFFNVLPF